MQEKANKIKKRESYFDNVKAVLIILVVLGHVVEVFKGIHPMYNSMYTLVYTFHMPLFIFVSGYFSKNLVKSREYAFRDFLVVYILFNTLYQVIMGGGELVNPFQPTFIYWYLLSMFLWKVFIQDIIKVRGYWIIVIVVALYVGSFDHINRFLSLSRTFVFFPYFILGYMANEIWIEKIKRIPRWLSLTMLILFLSGVSYVFNQGLLSQGLLLGADSYKTLGLSMWQGIISRLILYGIAIGISILLLNLIPKRKTFFTILGSRTMPIYLGHAYAILLLNKIGLPTVNPYKGIIFFMGITFIIVAILGNKYIFSGYEKCINTYKKIIVKAC